MLNRPVDMLLYPFLEGRVWQMTHAERSTLAYLLQSIKPKCSIEIGIAYGGSTSVISKYSEKVFSIDITPDAAGYVKAFPNVEACIGNSAEVIPNVLAAIEEKQLELEFVLIDGDHSLEGVRRDCRWFIESIKPRQPLYIVMHDSFNPRVREGIRSANWGDNPYVAALDLDFVPGRLSPFPGEYFRGMWGGIALAVLLPDKREGELQINAELDFESYLLLPFSAYTCDGDFASLNTTYQKPLASVVPAAQSIRAEMIERFIQNDTVDAQDIDNGELYHRIQSLETQLNESRWMVESMQQTRAWQLASRWWRFRDKALRKFKPK